MVIPSLAEFLIPAPSCGSDSTLRTLLHHCRDVDVNRSSPYCVLLDTAGLPTGCVAVAGVLAHVYRGGGSALENRDLSSWIAEAEAEVSEQQDSKPSVDLDRPLQQTIAHLIEPVGLLSAQVSLDRIWATLSQHQVWVIVGAQQCYLGLLDSWAILRFLAGHADKYELAAGLLGKATRPKQAAVSTSTAFTAQPTWRILATAFANSRLPVMFQSGQGQILSRNFAWEKHLGSWKPWQSVAASNAGTALAVSIAHQDELGLGGGSSGSHPRSPLDIDIRQTQVCDINQVCGQWEIIRIPILTRLSANSAIPTRPLPVSNLELTSDLEASLPLANPLGQSPTQSSANISSDTSDETVWLCLGQPHIARETVQETWQQSSNMSVEGLKDELLSCLNHELKSAITALLGLSKLLLDSRVGDMNERQTQYTRLIHHNAQNLKATVNEVLDVTRAISGQMALTPTPVVLETLLESAVTQAQTYNHLRQKLESGELSDVGDRIECNIQAGLEALFVDELRVRQILTHLLSNALKYTPYEGNVGISVERWSEWIALTVWDTGYGIDPNQQPLVFHRLQWSDNSISPLFLGPGVGLLLARQLAWLQGGELTFQSSPGTGSRFTLLLPYRSPKRVYSPGIQNKPSQSSRLVVLVDVDAAAIAAFSNQLQGLGYRVAIARSPQEAVDKATRLRPCAVFLRPAPTLPAESILQQLKQHDAIAELPIITLTRRRLNLPTLVDDDVIETPISNESLREILRHQTASAINRPLNVENTQLTVLYLKPPSQLRTPEHDNDLSLLLQQYDCRILEIDDIEQADLLVRIWKPQVALLDPGLDHNPMVIFQQIVHQPSLAILPLVTLTGPMTQAANSFSNLAVYPYLAPLETNALATAEASPLIEVLKIAAAQGGV